MAANGILRMLETLPEAQREILLMLKVSGMSIEEVALATQSTPNAVKQKAYRAFQSIRSALGLLTRKEDR